MRNQNNDQILSDKNRQKYDLRIKKTDRSLVEALFTLLSEKKFEDITVQAICDKATIRRATFYTHFADKYELFGFAIRYTYQTLPTYSKLNSPSRNKHIYIEMIDNLINFILQNLDLVESIRNSQLIHMMLNIISNEVVQNILHISEEFSETDLIESNNKELAINFYVRGVFGTLQWWVTENYPISKVELVDQIGLLLDFD